MKSDKRKLGRSPSRVDLGWIIIAIQAIVLVFVAGFAVFTAVYSDEDDDSVAMPVLSDPPNSPPPSPPNPPPPFPPNPPPPFPPNPPPPSPPNPPPPSPPPSMPVHATRTIGPYASHAESSSRGELFSVVVPPKVGLEVLWDPSSAPVLWRVASRDHYLTCNLTGALDVTPPTSSDRVVLRGFGFRTYYAVAFDGVAAGSEPPDCVSGSRFEIRPEGQPSQNPTESSALTAEAASRLSKVMRCGIPHGSEVLLQDTMVCDSVSVQGTLRVGDGSVVEARSLKVERNGSLLVGTRDDPVSAATIRLTHTCASGTVGTPASPSAVYSAEGCDSGSGALMSEGVTEMWGALKDSWSELSSDAPKGTKQIHVESCVGWKKGDSIAMAATGAGARSFGSAYLNRDSEADAKDNFYSEKYVLASNPTTGRYLPLSNEMDWSSGCILNLESPLRHSHSGSWVDGVFPVKAEVVNLDRSITITGPPISWFAPEAPIFGGSGIVTVQSHTGHMVMSHVRVENCGRYLSGRYCLHFHQLGPCPDCSFDGVVVERGTNKGITIHGTSNASVTNSVVYDVRGVSVYVEDGNEMHNRIHGNALLCPTLSNPVIKGDVLYEQAPANLCRDIHGQTACGGDLPSTGLDGAGHRCALYRPIDPDSPEGVFRDSDYLEQSAIYALSGRNEFVGNRAVGHDNALYVNHQSGKYWGVGSASGSVCIQALPHGRTSGNVFHNNAGFGWYMNVAFPAGVDQDHDTGFVSTTSQRRTCAPELEGGADNSRNLVVDNHLEYLNDFAFGGYDIGDVTFRDTVSAMNNKGIYFKTYRRGLSSDPWCDNCTFFDNTRHMECPGGTALVEARNTRVMRSELYINNTGGDGTNEIQINHHCALQGEMTGGLCSSHYDFRTLEVDGVPAVAQGLKKMTFSTEHPDPGKVRTDAIIMLRDATLMSLEGSRRAFDASTCVGIEDTTSLGRRWLSCPPSLGLRSVRIYSPDRGSLRVESQGATVDVPHMFPEGYKPQGNRHIFYTPPCPAPVPPAPSNQTTDCPSYIWPNGYTFVVSNNSDVVITIPEDSKGTTSGFAKADLFTLEYSEPQLERTSIRVTVKVGSSATAPLSMGPFDVSSNHTRAGITPYGPLYPQTGALWHASEGWVTRSTETDYYTALDAHLLQTSELGYTACPVSDPYNPRCAARYTPFGGRVVYDPACSSGSLGGGRGCGFAGSPCCRLCDTVGVSICGDISTPFTPDGSPPSPSYPSQPSPPPAPACPSTETCAENQVSDSGCLTGGLGCEGSGSCCRFCGSLGLATCSDSSVPYVDPPPSPPTPPAPISPPPPAPPPPSPPAPISPPPSPPSPPPDACAGEESDCAAITVLPPNTAVVYDPLCPNFGVAGCDLNGKKCCRGCDWYPFATCANRTVPAITSCAQAHGPQDCVNPGVEAVYDPRCIDETWKTENLVTQDHKDNFKCGVFTKLCCRVCVNSTWGFGCDSPPMPSSPPPLPAAPVS